MRGRRDGRNVRGVSTAVPPGVLRAIGTRPYLWGAAAGAVFALARRTWWRRPPFLPVPDEAFIRWRVSTAYGSDEHPIAPEDVVAYLEWRKRHRS